MLLVSLVYVLWFILRKLSKVFPFDKKTSVQAVPDMCPPTVVSPPIIEVILGPKCYQLVGVQFACEKGQFISIDPPFLLLESAW